MKYQYLRRKNDQQGLTLVELMVSLVISLIVILAAAAALVMSRQGFTQVDAASQLRDNAKFAENLIQRLAVQAGYRDVVFAATSKPASTEGMTVERPSVFGFNDDVRRLADRSEEASGSGNSVNGSDILVLRFQSAAVAHSSNTTDGAIIDCAGNALSKTMTDRYELYSSVFHIAADARTGEPNLVCTRWPLGDDYGSASMQPLISGVENFQVLYGVDGINAEDLVFSNADSVTDAYLRADQISKGTPEVSLQRWQRVRSIRIGMVIRAAPGTALGNTSMQTLPFGVGEIGEMFASQEDSGSIYNPDNDGRLRQVVSFTVHLRNTQE